MGSSAGGSAHCATCGAAGCATAGRAAGVSTACHDAATTDVPTGTDDHREPERALLRPHLLDRLRRDRTLVYRVLPPRREGRWYERGAHRTHPPGDVLS